MSEDIFWSQPGGDATGVVGRGQRCCDRPAGHRAAPSEEGSGAGVLSASTRPRPQGLSVSVVPWAGAGGHASVPCSCRVHIYVAQSVPPPLQGL